MPRFDTNWLSEHSGSLSARRMSAALKRMQSQLTNLDTELAVIRVARRTDAFGVLVACLISLRTKDEITDVVARWGRYGNAAVIHDFMYYDQSRSRREADDIFLEAMEVLEVGWVKRRVMHLAVRTFGWIAWRGSKSRKNAGRSKVASRLPEKSFETKQSLGW